MSNPEIFIKEIARESIIRFNFDDLLIYIYEKVLREHKRYTDRGVSSTTRWDTPLARSDGGGVPEVGYPPVEVPPLRPG